MTFRAPKAVFREYDIRGQADEQLSSELFERIGRAFPRLLGSGTRQRIAVARDCRLSSKRLHASLVDGLLATGATVLDIGVAPTPLLYFAVRYFGADGGLIVTGSHNPAEDNGLKMVRRGGPFYGDDITALRELIPTPTPPAKFAAVHEHHDVVPAYIELVRSGIRLASTDIDVVIDGGNGAGGPLAVRALRAIGLEPHALYCEMDGRFPNHHPDPTQPENLQDLIRAVRERGARVGLALDGDGDRLGAVDADGTIVWGDRLLTLFARDVLQRTPGATIIGEVKCSQTTYDDITARGGRAIQWKTGHSLIKAKMAEEGALLAGEMSGHFFFADRYYGYDDGIYAALRLVELLSAERKSIGELLADLPVTHATPEVRVACSDDTKFAIVRKIADELRPRVGSSIQGMQLRSLVEVDGIRIVLDEGWGLVRASNTQAVLVTRAEARSRKVLAHIEALLGRLIEDAKTATATSAR